VGGAFPHSARHAVRYRDVWTPQVTKADKAPFGAVIPRFRQMAWEVGRDPASMPIIIGIQPPDAALIEGDANLGVELVYPSLPFEGAKAILPMLDAWVEIMRRLNDQARSLRHIGHAVHDMLQHIFNVPRRVRLCRDGMYNLSHYRRNETGSPQQSQGNRISK
jgi:hypothetical protein